MLFELSWNEKRNHSHIYTFYLYNPLAYFYSSGLRFPTCLSATIEVQKSVIKDVLTVQTLDVSWETTLITYVGSPIYAYGLTVFLNS